MNETAPTVPMGDPTRENPVSAGTVMTPWEQARKFYGANWWDTLGHYACHHFVYASPTCIALACSERDCWWIEYLAGDMKEALQHLPAWKPQIRFSRRGFIRTYWTANLVKKLLRNPTFIGKGNHASVQNGPTDPLPRGRRQQSEATQATPAPLAYDRC